MKTTITLLTAVLHEMQTGRELVFKQGGRYMKLIFPFNRRSEVCRCLAIISGAAELWGGECAAKVTILSTI